MDDRESVPLTEPVVTGKDVAAVAALLESKRVAAIDRGTGVMLSWEDARGFQLVLSAAAERLTEMESLRSALSSEREARETMKTRVLEAVQGVLNGLERYGWSDRGMLDERDGHWVEWMRLPWRLTNVISAALAGSVSASDAAVPDDVRATDLLERFYCAYTEMWGGDNLGVLLDDVEAFVGDRWKRHSDDAGDAVSSPGAPARPNDGDNVNG